MKLFRPTEKTKFHIDFAWFDDNGQDVRVLIHKCLTPEQQERLGSANVTQMYDYVDDATGEVQRVDEVLHILRTVNSKDANFVNGRTPVFEAAFRLLLLNNNQPLTPVEMAEKMMRKPAEVLNQLSGRTIYNGIRPIFDN